MPPHPKTPSSHALFKSRLVLPFWHRLNQVVLEKRPLNGCSSSSSVTKNTTSYEDKIMQNSVWECNLTDISSFAAFLRLCLVVDSSTIASRLLSQAHTALVSKSICTEHNNLESFGNVISALGEGKERAHPVQGEQTYQAAARSAFICISLIVSGPLTVSPILCVFPTACLWLDVSLTICE